MGQKTNPIGFRLGVTHDHRSRWYADRNFPALLKEDELIRKYLKARLGHAAIAQIDIERRPGKVTVTVHTGRPMCIAASISSAWSTELSDSTTTGRPGGRGRPIRLCAIEPTALRTWA